MNQWSTIEWSVGCGDNTLIVSDLPKFVDFDSMCDVCFVYFEQLFLSAQPVTSQFWPDESLWLLRLIWPAFDIPDAIAAFNSMQIRFTAIISASVVNVSVAMTESVLFFGRTCHHHIQKTTPTFECSWTTQLSFIWTIIKLKFYYNFTWSISNWQ